MHVLKTIGKCVREYRRPSILAPAFIVVEVVMETVIPMIMSILIDEFENGMSPVLKFGAILLAMAVASSVFFISYYLLTDTLGNHALWLAFLAYLGARSGVEALCHRAVAARVGRQSS